MNKNLLYLIIIVVSVIIQPKSSAQIVLNGAVDFELSAGGEDSRFITNGISRNFKNLNASVTSLNGFIFASISEHFFFESRIQLDTWGNGTLNSPRIALASITWDNPDKSYILKAGRFVSPFGFYSKRQLSTDRVFVQEPLGYSYFTNISDKRGYWPQAGNTLNEEYDEGDVGLSTLYFGGYVTGVGASWEINPEKLMLDIALTNGSPITIKDRSTLPNLGILGRLFYRPFIYWEQGISASIGHFLQGDSFNEPIRKTENFQNFYHILLGSDTKLAFTYFEIVGEIIYSKWNTPGFISNTFDREGISNNGDLKEYKLSNISGNIDFKYEPPTLTGSYLALRAEYLHFMEAKDPETNTNFNWDDDVSRITAVIGYKLSPSLLLKVSLSDQGDFDTSEYAFRLQLSAFF